MDSEDNQPDNSDAFDEFLRKMLGPEGSEEAARAMREQGFDPSSLGKMLPNPSQLDAAMSHFHELMGTTSGAVNWDVAKQIAVQEAGRKDDPSLTSAQAEEARQAMAVADLWLDSVTDFSPGQVTRGAWTRVEWIHTTLPGWKPITEPVAENVSRSLSEALTTRFGEDTGVFAQFPEGLPIDFSQLAGPLKDMMPRLASLVFAMQIGQALAAMATEALGSTDVGIPLAPSGTTALVVNNISAFSEGLEIPFIEILQFLAARECAHHRLFASVPWLSYELMRAIRAYATEIAIDTDSISEAAQNINPMDPSSANEILTGHVFAADPTEVQQAALEKVETLLALIEGWVENIVHDAVTPFLPHADQLQEMIRRRRANGGPAEQILGSLIGLQMRPRRARGAAKLFYLVKQNRGSEGRDAIWDHPDVIPTVEELDAPESYLRHQQELRERDAAIDAELTQILEGTLGWAEGLSPDVDPESDALNNFDNDNEESQHNEGNTQIETKDDDTNSDGTNATTDDDNGN